MDDIKKNVKLEQFLPRAKKFSIVNPETESPVEARYLLIDYIGDTVNKENRILTDKSKVRDALEWHRRAIHKDPTILAALECPPLYKINEPPLSHQEEENDLVFFKTKDELVYMVGSSDQETKGYVQGYLEIIEATKIGDTGWLKALAEIYFVDFNFTIIKLNKKTNNITTTNLIEIAAQYDNPHIIDFLVGLKTFNILSQEKSILQYITMKDDLALLDKLLKKHTISEEYLNWFFNFSCVNNSINVIYYLLSNNLIDNKLISTKSLISSMIVGCEESPRVFMCLIDYYDFNTVLQNNWGYASLFIDIESRLSAYDSLSVPFETRDYRTINIIIRTLIDKEIISSKNIEKYTVLQNYIKLGHHLR